MTMVNEYFNNSVEVGVYPTFDSEFDTMEEELYIQRNMAIFFEYHKKLENGEIHFDDDDDDDDDDENPNTEGNDDNDGRGDYGFSYYYHNLYPLDDDIGGDCFNDEDDDEYKKVDEKMTKLDEEYDNDSDTDDEYKDYDDDCGNDYNDMKRSRQWSYY
jgi:hypothetical protein